MLGVRYSSRLICVPTACLLWSYKLPHCIKFDLPATFFFYSWTFLIPPNRSLSYVYVCKVHVLYETFCFTLAYHYTVHRVSNILNSPKEIRQSSTISLLEENRTSEAIRHQGIHKSRKWYSFSLWWNKTMWDKKHPPKKFQQLKKQFKKMFIKIVSFLTSCLTTVCIHWYTTSKSKLINPRARQK